MLYFGKPLLSLCDLPWIVPGTVLCSMHIISLNPHNNLRISAVITLIVQILKWRL